MVNLKSVAKHRKTLKLTIQRLGAIVKLDGSQSHQRPRRGGPECCARLPTGTIAGTARGGPVPRSTRDSAGPSARPLPGGAPVISVESLVAALHGRRSG